MVFTIGNAIALPLKITVTSQQAYTRHLDKSLVGNQAKIHPFSSNKITFFGQIADPDAFCIR